MLSNNSIKGKASYGWSFLFFISCLLLPAKGLFAQDARITRNEDPSEYILQMDFESAEKSRVWDTTCSFASGLKYPGKVQNEPSIDPTSGMIQARFGYYLYHPMAFMKQVEGAVFADLDLMFQGDRVTATIHNIYYMEYARDRYGKFSPKTSKKYTLEELNKKKARDSRKKHLQTIDKNMRMLLTNLHQTLSEIKSASIH
jgi:hypothetical protein